MKCDSKFSNVKAFQKRTCEASPLSVRWILHVSSNSWQHLLQTPFAQREFTVFFIGGSEHSHTGRKLGSVPNSCWNIPLRQQTGRYRFECGSFWQRSQRWWQPSQKSSNFKVPTGLRQNPNLRAGILLPGEDKAFLS